MSPNYDLIINEYLFTYLNLKYIKTEVNLLYLFIELIIDFGFSFIYYF